MILSDLQIQVFGHEKCQKQNNVFRIITALNFVRKHPETVGQIGVTWARESGVFATNEFIYSTFLGITRNGLNKNFLHAGFEQCKVRPEDFPRLLDLPPGAIIPDPGHWKLRRHKRIRLAEDITPEKAAELTSISRAGVGGVDWLPEKMRHQVSGLMKSTGRDASEQQAITDLALRLWQESFSEPTVCVHDALPKLFPKQQPQICTNFVHLWNTITDHRGKFTCTLSFVQFLEIFMRYGTPSGLEEGLADITPPGVELSDSVFMAGVGVAVTRDVVLEHLRESPVNSWVIVEGGIPGSLELLQRGRQIQADQPTLVTAEITVNPSDHKKRFTVGGKVSATSWAEVLGLLRVDPQLGLQHIGDQWMRKDSGHIPSAIIIIKETPSYFTEPLVMARSGQLPPVDEIECGS
jgi:hypothetical protein